MIWQVIEIHLRRLRHNRVEWVLAFVVPIAFFSVFALIFTHGVGSTPRVKVALVESDSPRCQHVLAELSRNEGLQLIRGPDDSIAVDRATAELLVRRGTATIAVALHEKDRKLSAELLNDASDQVAGQVVTALLTRALLMAGPAPNSRPAASSPLRDSESAAERAELAAIVQNVAAKPDPTAYSAPQIELVNLIGQGKANPLISVYAAGIAVMFLLFGATSGGGVLLEERENQTLERLLATHLTIDQLLLGKWFYLTLLGCIQVTVMFAWAQLVFGLNLLGHLDGFAMMTVATAAAASSFGLFLATLCRTRGQLGGLSVVAVLTMSALGGSMVPRYVMSESLQRAGLWTFNAWALDGYDKVFWRELPASELAPQLAVLMGTAFVLLAIARVLAIRWEVT